MHVALSSMEYAAKGCVISLYNMSAKIKFVKLLRRFPVLGTISPGVSPFNFMAAVKRGK